MKYIIIVLAPLLLLVSSCQQEISPEQAEKFIKFYGNALMDVAKDVEVLDDGSYAICGIDSVAGEGKRMVLVVTDKYGNINQGFPRYYSEENFHSGANAMVVKNGGQGGFLLVGYVERPTGGPVSQKDLFLVKTSRTGDEHWKKSFGSQEDESILHATEMISSGGYILAGYQVQDGKKDIMVMGVNETGDSIELGLNYNNPFADNASANYIYNTGEQYLCICTYNNIWNDDTDILILNFDDELSPNDEILGDEGINEIGRCIVEDSTDRYLVLGNSMNITGNSEVVVHLIEINGLLITKSLQVETISEIDTDLIAERLIKTEDGRFAIVGTRKSNGNRDIFLQFLRPDYQEAERLIYGSAGNQSGADIALPDGDGLLMLGTNGNGETSMMSLIKTGDAGDL
ncbi:MAG: hypothetical protein KAT15_01480 [Bacteroidales bacterium]|nr:hypothetical protein [Bacteroidales bacterium]